MRTIRAKSIKQILEWLIAADLDEWTPERIGLFMRGGLGDGGSLSTGACDALSVSSMALHGCSWSIWIHEHPEKSEVVRLAESALKRLETKRNTFTIKSDRPVRAYTPKARKR